MKKYLIWTLVVLALVLTSPYILAEQEYTYVENTTLKFLPVSDLQPITMGYYSEEYGASFIVAEVIKSEEMQTLEDFGNFVKTRNEYTLLLEQVNPVNGSALYLLSAQEEDSKLLVYVYLLDGEGKFGQMVVTAPAENFSTNLETLLQSATSMVWTGEKIKTTFTYSLALPGGWNFVQRVDTMDVYVKGEQVTEDTPTVVVVDYQTPMDQTAIETLLSQPDWDGDKILSHETLQIGNLKASLFTLEEEEEGVVSVNHGCFIFAEETTYFLMTLEQFMSVGEFKNVVSSFKLN